jgi:hypothetical protein
MKIHLRHSILFFLLVFGAATSVNSQVVPVAVQGFIYNNQSQALPSYPVHIVVDSAFGGAAFTYTSTVTSGPVGYYCDTVLLPAGTYFAIVTVYVYDCNNQIQSNMQVFTPPTPLPLINFAICTQVTPLAYQATFDSVNTWYTDTTNIWQLGTPNASIINTAYSAPNAWATVLNGNYPNNSNAYLYTPVFNTMGLGAFDTLVLSFRHWMAVADAGDYGQVEYSVNGGMSWYQLGFYQDPFGTNWVNQVGGGLHFFNYTNSGWMLSSYKLLPAIFNAQPAIQFRFKFFSNSSGVSNGWAIDNFGLNTIPFPPNSVLITQILYPVNDTFTGTSIHPTISLKNKGSNTLTLIPLVINISGLVTAFDVWQGTLLPGDSTLFTFTTPYVVPSGPYNLCIQSQMAGPMATTWNSTLCKSFAGMVSPFGYLYGLLSTPSGAAGPSEVYLIQHDSLAGTLTAIDTVLSIDSAGVTRYAFPGVMPGTYLVKAAMLPANPNYAASMPTYHASSLFWNQATTIQVLANTFTQGNISYIQGINPGGPGFIGGLVSQGANKGPGDPIAGVQMLLLDANNGDQPVAVVYSDAAGVFGFTNISYGTYKVYAEMINKTTIPVVVTIDATTPSTDGIKVVVGTTVISYIDDHQGFSAGNAGPLYPNPTAGNSTIELSILRSATISAEVFDLAGKLIYAETLTLPAGNTTVTIESEQLGAGSYLLILKHSDGSRMIRKLVKTN